MAQEQDEQPRSRRGTSEGMPVDTLPQKVQLECSKFVARLRRQQVPHALDIARKTLEIMRLVVATSGAKDLGGLIALIKQAGQILVSAQPHELVIGNMVRRVLYIVREETREQTMAPVTLTLHRHHSPLTLTTYPHPSPLTTHHSPLTTHPSPSTSPLTAHRSPLTTHLSPLTAHHSPLTFHHSPSPSPSP